ncbi:MAG: tol-pal system YbgF family protein [Sandaracinaceae bacterium]
MPALSPRSILAALVALVVGTPACGGAPSTPTPPPPAGSVAVTRVVARAEQGRVVVDAYGAAELFAAATDALVAGRCEAAVRRYDRLVAEFPDSALRSAARYNAAFCLHEAGELERAVARYRALLIAAPRPTDARHALLQLTDALEATEAWAGLLEVAERLLVRDDLAVEERLEGMSRRARALLALGRVAAAAAQAREAVRYHRRAEAAGPADAAPDGADGARFAAAASYVLAEALRLRSERIGLSSSDASGRRRALAERTHLLLEAQAHYLATVRYHVAPWSEASAAGLADLYGHLWRSAASAPARASRTEARGPSPEELGRHVEPLLRHAIRSWDLTVGADGAPEEWAERTRQELLRLRQLARREAEG